MIALLVLAAAAVAPQPASLKTFGDWTVGCDNGRACQAVALVPEAEDRDAYLLLVITRAADAKAGARLSWPEPAAGVLSVDGKAVARSSSGGVTIDGALAAALAQGKRVELRGANAKLSASLTGLAATLLFIDEAQRRLGTTTALVRTGPRVADARAPALPVVVEPPATTLAPRTLSVARATTLIGREAAVCEYPNFKVAPAAYRLDARHTLALVEHPCGNGAYNFFTSAYLIDEGRTVSPARFDAASGMGDGASNVLVTADWDAKTRRLVSYEKSRGLGDCGTLNTFAWDGTQFRLVQQEVMSECRGSTDYITTWRATVVRR